MAENTADLGEAIGLQTEAQPYSGNAITKGIQSGIQNQLRKDLAAAQKKQAAEAKRAAVIANIKPVGLPALSKRNAGAARKIVEDGLVKSFDFITKGDKMGSTMAAIQTESDVGQIQKLDNYEQSYLNSRKLLPSRLVKALSSESPTAMSENNVDFDYFDFITPNNVLGRESFIVNRDVDDINIEQTNRSVLKEVTSGKPLTLTGSRILEKYGAVKNLNDKDLEDISSILINQDQQYRDNTLVKYEDRVKKRMDFYLQKDQDIDIREAKELALEDVAFENLKKVYNPKYSLVAVPKDNNLELSFDGGGNAIVDNKNIASPIETPDRVYLEKIIPKDDIALGQGLAYFNRPIKDRIQKRSGAFAFTPIDVKGSDGKEAYSGKSSIIIFNNVDKKAYLIENYKEGASMGFAGTDEIKAIPITETEYKKILTSSGMNKNKFDNIFEKYIPDVANPTKKSVSQNKTVSPSKAPR